MEMLTFWNALKSERVALAFAVLIGGVLTVRFGAPVVPVLLGCSISVVATSALKAMRAKR